MNTTTTRPGFTKTQNTSGVATYAPCVGTHHSDGADLGRCDGCGVEVGKTETGRILDVIRHGRWNARRVVCWSKGHTCDPEMAAIYTAARAEKMASGEIIKGQTVTVVKGRKVPIGTTGTVIWVGEDNYGKARIGIKTADGETHFTAESNLKAVSA